MVETQLDPPPVAAIQAAEHTVKHLEMVQAVINRLANNSFLLKGWSVSLAAALVGVSANESVPWFSLAAVLPAISFWVLDAYYLRQERLYRALYDAVRVSPPAESGLGPFTLSTRGFETRVDTLVGTIFAPTVFGIHGPTLCVALAASLVLGAL